MHKPLHFLLLVCLLIPIPLVTLVQFPTQGAANGGEQGHFKTEPNEQSKREMFPLTAVTLLDGPFKEAKDRNLQYLLENEPDRLLHWHRKAAGLEPKADHYGGWENGGSNLLGHYLTACAQTYAATGDKRLLERVNYMVDELEKCQQNRQDGALFNDPGMAGNFEKMRQGQMEFKIIGPEFPLVNGGNPWYGIHKVLAGLRDAYLYGNNQKARRVLVKFSDWAYDFAIPIAEAPFQKVLDVEHGGMTEVFADVYVITGDRKYLELAKKFVHQRVAQPIAEGRDMLYPHHANAQIPKFVGYERLYQLVGEVAAPEGKSALNFWDIVQRNHTVVIGGNSEYERFGPAGQVSRRIGYSSSETCNTYNMLKLSNLLYQRTGDAKYMEYYERALYNHILASVGPEEGMYCYYTNLKPGHFKTFSTKFNSSWCCVGSGMENPAKYGEAIYSHSEKDLFVNLYLSSQLDWQQKNFVIRQETRFPESDTVRFRIEQAGKAPVALYLRQPHWTNNGMKIWVNGKPYPASSPGNGYIPVRHKWKKGDQLQVLLPMQLHLEETPDNPNVAALLYGPVVLAGELGRKGMENVSLRAGDMWDNEKKAEELKDIPFFVADKGQLTGWIKPVGSKTLTFTAKSAGEGPEITFSPFYKINRQRYSVYWDLFSPQEWETYCKRKKECIRDAVVVEDSTSETAHRVRGEKMTKGTSFFKTFRTAKEGGWFAYDLAADTNEPLFLMCQFWGGGWGPDTKGTMDVYVEDAKIGTRDFTQKDHQTLFFDAVYPIPPQLSKGKDKLSVRFQALPGEVTTGLFGCKLVTAQGLVIKDLLKEQ